MRAAMITVEVLVSLLILFMVIATSVSTIKQLNSFVSQQNKHEENYMAVLNIKDFIDDKICLPNNTQIQGELFGIQYEAKCHLLKELRSYKKAFEDGEPEGNIGNIMLKLYNVLLTIKRGSFEATYSYKKTILEKQE